MRHAQPVDPTKWHGGDGTRPLSDEGKGDLILAVEAMRRQGFTPNVILTSPLERAKETADRIADNQPGLHSVVVQELTPGAAAQTIRQVVLRYRDRARVLIVGHMPDLVLFASNLTGDPGLMNQAFRPGEVWALESGAIEKGWGTGKILWQRELPEWQRLPSRT